MPRIILLQPFVRHYAGTVMDLPDEIEVPDWPEEDWVREKQNYSSKRAYTLADAGNGRPETLPLYYTALCPEEVFAGVDLCSGPCRVTSISNGLEDAELDRLESEGRGKIRLDGEEKHNIRLYLETAISLEIKTRPGGQAVSCAVWHQTPMLLDFSACPPGFYEVNVQERGGARHVFTVMKNFPLVVEYDTRTRKYTTKKTIW